MTSVSKPNCYICLHHESLSEPGMLACGHPAALETRTGPKARVMEIASGWWPIDAVVLGVVFTKDACEAGRASWPFRFDPAGLLACVGFESG